MPFRPDRVAGGLRLWLATFFTDWLSEASGLGTEGFLVARGRRPAQALTASVMDSAPWSTLLAPLFVVARPERFVECGDFFCRRAILLDLRNTATSLQTVTKRQQLAQSLGHDLQFETARSAQAFLDRSFPVLSRRHGVQDDGSPTANLGEIDEVRGVLERLQIEHAALQRYQHHGGGFERWDDCLIELRGRVD